MATLGLTFGGAFLALRGGDKPEQQQGPPLNAKTKEEESFIKYEDASRIPVSNERPGHANKHCRQFVNKAEGDKGDKKQ